LKFRSFPLAIESQCILELGDIPSAKFTESILYHLASLLLSEDNNKVKCYVHPDEEACAVCQSCGKGICKDCNVDIAKISFCKECVKSGKVTIDTAKALAAEKGISYAQPEAISYNSVPPQATLRSKTTAVALLIVGITYFFLVDFFFTIASETFTELTELLRYYMIFGFSCWVILAISIMLAGSGLRAVKSKEKHTSGTQSFMVAIPASLAILISLILYWVAAFSEKIIYFGLYTLTYYLGFALFGCTLLGWGVFCIKLSGSLGKSRLGKAAGWFFIISAIIVFPPWVFSVAVPLPVGLFYIGAVLTLVSTILAAIAAYSQKPPAKIKIN
jgi:hypothetical protein